MANPYRTVIGWYLRPTYLGKLIRSSDAPVAADFPYVQKSNNPVGRTLNSRLFVTEHQKMCPKHIEIERSFLYCRYDFAWTWSATLRLLRGINSSCVSNIITILVSVRNILYFYLFIYFLFAGWRYLALVLLLDMTGVVVSMPNISEIYLYVRYHRQRRYAPTSPSP